jgi:hypothetical protein
MKEVTEFSDEELKEIWNRNNKQAQDIRSIYITTYEGLEYEISRIGLIFSDFTQKASVLMTLSGLLAFLPSVINPKKGLHRAFFNLDISIFALCYCMFIFFLHENYFDSYPNSIYIPGTFDELLV